MKTTCSIFFFLFLIVSTFSLQAQTRKNTNKKKAATTAKAKTVSKKTSKKTTAKPIVKKNNTGTNTNTQSLDTAKPDVVVIYAAFKPSLRNAAKLNFTAASAYTDTSKIVLQYNVPAQNLFFSYQPVPLKPLALYIDSSYTWHNNQYIKAGYGSYATPYVETGLNFGDGVNKNLSIFGLHTSSKGNLPFQQFGRTILETKGKLKLQNNHSVSGELNYHNNTQYLYGYEPQSLVFNKSDLKRAFNSITLKGTFSRDNYNEFGIAYAPSLSINYFFDNKTANELNVITQVPVTKKFNERISIDVGLLADITAYKDTLKKINNNIFALNTAVTFKGNNVKLIAGITPTWDNSETVIMPNIKAEAKIKDERFIAEAGFVGNVIKNNYRNLAQTNPFLQQPFSQLNTRNTELFAGFKGSAGSHFTYKAQVGFVTMKYMPTFTNDLLDGKTFEIFYDTSLQAVKIHGEIGYSIKENFSFLAGTTIYQFTKSDNDKPYGIIPMEITGSLRWKLLKDLHVKGDIFIWDGPRYRTKTLTQEKLDAAIDLNIGAEYSLMPKLNLWLQFNNLLNNRYQRWHQYQVLGLNVLGGVVYSFN